METVTVAFVGCGQIAIQYVAVYCAYPWVRLVLCMDIDASLAATMADFCASLGVARPRVSTDFNDVLAETIDVVVINTPNDLHAVQATAALAAGRNVLLQKPLAAHLADAERIAAAAASARGTAGMYMSYLDQPLLHDLKDLVAAGFYGEVVEFYARSMHTNGPVWSRLALEGGSSWRNSVERTGGGCFIQLAVHYIYLAQWILDARIVEVQAFNANLHSPGLEGEDLGIAWMRTDRGPRILISTSWCSLGEQLSITGTQGASDYLNNSTLMLSPPPGFSFHGRTLALHGVGGARQTTEVIAPAWDDSRNPLNQHLRFLQAIRDGRQPDATVDQALQDMRVLDACYRSAALRAPVLVEQARKPDAPAMKWSVSAPLPE